MLLGVALLICGIVLLQPLAAGHAVSASRLLVGLMCGAAGLCIGVRATWER